MDHVRAGGSLDRMNVKNGMAINFFFSKTFEIETELKIQPALNAVLIPPHLRGGTAAAGLLGGINSGATAAAGPAASTSQDSSTTGSPNSAGGEGPSGSSAAAVAAGHGIHPPADVCSTTGETLGAVGTA